MPMLHVKTKPGRRAFYEGREIPNDKFIPVADSAYMRRLIQHWGDVEVEGGDLPEAGQLPNAGQRKSQNPSPKSVEDRVGQEARHASDRDRDSNHDRH